MDGMDGCRRTFSKHYSSCSFVWFLWQLVCIFCVPMRKKKLEQIFKIFGKCFKFWIETYSVEQYK